MDIPWGLVALVGGVAYGYFTPGRQDKSQLFKKGILIGLVVALVLAAIGFVFGASPIGIGVGGFLGLLVSALVITLVFVLGVWLGDLVEGKPKRT